MSIFVLLLLVAAITNTFIVVYIWPRRQDNSETIPIVLLLLAATEWVVTNLGGLLDQNLAHLILWTRVEYLGVVSVPLALFVYVLYRSDLDRRLTVSRLVWLAIIPAATLLLVWTNGLHHLFWITFVPYLANGLVLAHKVYGPGFWVFWVYSYLILLAATLLTIRTMLRSARLFRWQSLAVVIGILAPWVGNLLYVFHLDPIQDLDFTPLAFSISAIMLAVGMFRWQLFDIKPIAQSAVIAGMADGLLIIDRHGRLLLANPAAQAILGHPGSEMVGKPLEQFIPGWRPPGDGAPPPAGKTIEIKLPGSQGNLDYELRDSPFYEKRALPGGRIIFLHDVTGRKRLEESLQEAERKRAEALLQQSENKYAILFKNMSVGVIYQNVDGRVVDMNPAAASILGVDQAQISNVDSIYANLITIHTDGSAYPAEEHPSMVSLRTGLPVRNQVMGIYSPNEKAYRWIIINAMPQFKPGEDKPYQAFVTLDDITESRRAAEKNALLAAIVESSDAAIIGKDLDGTITSWNRGAQRMYGYSGDEMIGRPISVLIPPDRADELPEFLEKLKLGGSIDFYETKRLKKDGQSFYVTLTISPIRDADGRIIAASTITRDISERKQSEEALAQQTEELARLYRASASLLTDATLDLNGLARTIIKAVLNEFGQSNCSIFLLENETRKVNRIAVAGPFADQVSKVDLSLDGPGLVPMVVRTGQVINTPDVRMDPAYFPSWEAARSELTIPLKIGGQVTGVIDIQSAEPAHFSAADERLMSIFAERAALALEDARLYSQTERHLENLNALLKVDTAITSSFDIRLTLSILVSQVVKAFKVDAANVLIFNPINQIFESSVAQGVRSHASELPANSLAWQVVRGRQEVTLVGQPGGPEERSLPAGAVQAGFTAYMGVPLIAKGQVKGVLELYQRGPINLDHESHTFLETLAGQTAVAIDSAQLFEDLQGSKAELMLAYDETIEGWSQAMELRDKETVGHSRRVTELTIKLAGSISFSSEDLVHIRRGALLHDIGNLGVPDDILRKAGPLTDEEWVSLRKHPQFAYDLLSSITYLRPALDIPYNHHEKWDGSGYPRGLKENQIPLAARIFTVVDVWDALTSDRPYRPAWPREKALDYMLGQSGKHFDPTVVGVFLNSIRPPAR